MLVICLLSCDNTYDAEKTAQRYCDCMKTNNAVTDFIKASQICGDKLAVENRYIKLWSVDMNNRELDKKISNETRDSGQSFMNTFTGYTNTHCCEETLACVDRD